MNDSTQTTRETKPGASAAFFRTISAGEQLTIYTVEAVGAALRAELGGAMELAIDLGSVAACDSLGVQLLWSARRSAEQAGKSVRFLNVPEAVNEAARAIACESVLAGKRVGS
jgi:anti-anti-sigma regulatory factor